MVLFIIQDIFMEINKNSALSYETFETISSFKLSVSHGADVEVVWKDIIYSITHVDNNKISICQAYKQETELLYDTADELLTYLLQTGETLRDVITKAEISDCTLYL